MRRRALVDTWAWLALAVADDARHGEALRGSARLRSDGYGLITTNLIVTETLTRLRYDSGHAVAVSLAATLETLEAEGSLTTVYIDAVDHRAALRWLRHYADQVFSFVDCTSFAVMERLGVTEAFTADRHFATAGFTPLA